MLKSLSIENVALIDKLELELGKGLNILSGETGAGKSIIIDSLNFVLGERADKSLIRYGTSFAAVEAVFDEYLNEGIFEYLTDTGIEPEDILILRRKMSSEGKNECRINGKSVTLSILKGLTELLVDIYGQHEHQSLLKASNHLNFLDGIAGNDVPEEKTAVKREYSEYTDIKNRLSELGKSDERGRKLDILKYQIEEIEKTDVKEGEEEELLDKRKRIRNLEKLLNAFESAANAINGDAASAVTQIKNSSAALHSVASYDARIDAILARLDNTKAELIDLNDTVSSMLDELNFDGKTADEVEERLENVRNITRKYGGTFTKLNEFYINANLEFETLSNAEELVADLEGQLKRRGETLFDAAQKLTASRQKAADNFELEMIKELADLGMSGSRFKVEIQTVQNIDDIRESGADETEFLISPNIGEPLKPLSKIISGGEMSRFMLALKNITANTDMIGTMVFDEIDTGISGRIAAVVAEKMCNISRSRQVIAVTHMATLASMADYHYLIEKGVVEGKTLTSVKLLEDDTAEIARLIGGNASEHALPHAKDMKAAADKYKEGLKIKK